MPWLACLTLGAMLQLTAARAEEPDVNVIASRHLSAVGGADALRAMKSWRMIGSLTAADGTVMQTLSEHKRPNKCRLESDVGGKRRIRGYNGRIAWSWIPGNSPQVLTGEDARQVIESCEFDDDPLLDYVRRGIVVRTMGLVGSDGTRAYKLYTETPGGVRRYIYIDASTYVDVRRDYVDADGTVTVQHLADRRKIGGILTATSWLMTDADGGDPARAHAEAFEVDPAISDSRFELPPR